MPPLSASFQLLREHLSLGVIAALLFAAGLGTSVPAVRRDVRWLTAFPLWIIRRVMRLIGPSFPPVRVFLVIFCFNSVAIFLYMASGVLIVLPAAIAFLTGVNIGVILLKAGDVELPSGERPLVDGMAADLEVDAGPLVGLCSLAVIVIELPCFWISVGMGIGLAHELTRAGQYTFVGMGSALAPRVAAYVCIIIPALFLSALAETAAIRGHVGGEAASTADPAEPDASPNEPPQPNPPAEEEAQEDPPGAEDER